jgi:hypothetical protein
MRRLLPLIAMPVASCLVFACAEAVEVPRDEYLKLMPLERPRLVQQTAASDALHLYGDRADPDYRDVAPVDGIDDRRYEVLETLAVRFAPFLVQNTSEFPTNFDVYIENAESFPLHIDTWDITGHEPRLIGTEQIDFVRLREEECGSPSAGDAAVHGPAPGDPAGPEDCRLLELLDRLAPGGSTPPDAGDPRVWPRPHLLEVLFFDFPGEGPENWAQAYRPEYDRTPEERRPFFPHAYVHPFLQDVTDDAGTSLGYELVLQYWFFYPTNDSGMNHEGDWEHLNVVISPRSLVERPLPAGTIRDILDGAHPATDDAPDPLVIRRLDYYFHHSVMTLDFSAPNVYQPRDSWKEDVKSRPTTRLQESEIWEHTRYLAYLDDAETRVNTHPLGYIGSDNKGIDQLLASPGGKNRNPHGTFPFPGRYTNVGPGGTTDQISVYVDPRSYRKKLEAGQETTGPEFRRGRVLGLAAPERLRIVPDWERVIDLVREDAQVRRDWSWLVLPIHFGYPATESPFSGVLENFDTGNLSVVGPPYNGGWNVSGPGPGFSAYEPHTLPSIFPLGPQDSFRNDLGFLNAPLVLLNLPPLDFATRIVSYPFKRVLGRRDPVYYPKETVPFRFVGISSGISVQKLDRDFNTLAINPQQFDEFIIRFLEHYLGSGADSTTVVVGGQDYVDDAVGPFLQIPFYIGKRFASENTVRNVRSTFGTNVEFSNIPTYRYSADIDMWEYAGSIRYSLTTSRLQPFVKGGYGWAWYRIENVQANGVPFEPAESEWIKPRNLWPNVWHFGAGVEFIPWRRYGKFTGGAEIAFRLEYARYVQDLGLDLSGVTLDRLDIFFDTLGEVPGNSRVTRDDFLAGVTLSF